ncbi:MAG: PAS domain S-box protein [Candidatus Altiarchaeota archaeon]
MDTPAQKDKKLGFRALANLLFITLTALILILSLIAIEIRTDMGLDFRNKVLANLSIIIITAYATIALLAYSRYETRLEATVAERTRELKDSMSLKKDIVDNSPLGMLMVSNEGVIEYASPSMRYIAGVRTEEDLIGLSVLDLQSTRESGLFGYFSMGLAGKPFDVDDIAYTSHTSGKKTIRHYHGVPLKDEAGDVKSLLLLIEDVTDKKKVESELKLIIDGTSVPLFVIDPEHRVVLWNRAMEGLTGLRQANILGTKDQWKAFYDEKRPTLADTVIDGKEAAILGEYDAVKPSPLIPGAYYVRSWMMGGKKQVLMTAAPIYDRENTVIAAVQTIQDLSDIAADQEQGI